MCSSEHWSLCPHSSEHGGPTAKTGNFLERSRRIPNPTSPPLLSSSNSQEYEALKSSRICRMRTLQSKCSRVCMRLSRRTLLTSSRWRLLCIFRVIILCTLLKWRMSAAWLFRRISGGHGSLTLTRSHRQVIHSRLLRFSFVALALHAFLFAHPFCFVSNRPVSSSMHYSGSNEMSRHSSKAK